MFVRPQTVLAATHAFIAVRSPRPHTPMRQPIIKRLVIRLALKLRFGIDQPAHQANPPGNPRNCLPLFILNAVARVRTVSPVTPTGNRNT